MSLIKLSVPIVFCISAFINTAKAVDDLARMQGSWKCTEFQYGGEADKRMSGVVVTIKDSTLTFERKDNPNTMTLRLEEKETPKRLVVKGHFTNEFPWDIEVKGIYSIDDAQLVICLSKDNNSPRPTEFLSNGQNGQVKFVLQKNTR